MKKIITLSLFFVLFLSSCSIDWNWEKDNELFKKKEECWKYYNELITQLKEKYWSSFYINWVKQIFYSPVNNSCLYEEWWLESSLDVSIKDAYTKNTIIKKDINNEDFIEWNKKIKELKWE